MKLFLTCFQKSSKNERNKNLMSAASNALAERILANGLNQFVKIRKHLPNITSRNMAEFYLAAWGERLKTQALKIQQRKQKIEEEEFDDTTDLEKFYNLPKTKKSLRIVKEVKDE